MKVFLRFLIASLFLAFLATTFCKTSFAQTYPSDSNYYTMPNITSDVPTNTHTLTQGLLYDILSAAACQISGIDPTTPGHQCLQPDSTTGKLGYSSQNNHGLLGTVTHLIGVTFNIPVSSHDYIAYVYSNFGLVHQSYAATDVGFSGISPLLSIWATFRNIVYLLFVIVFIVIGIAIMLRVQIDPRTVMTIENQLPKIVIGLILVTFSYAIAGFLIDLMWILTFFGINVIANTDTRVPFTQVATNKVLQNPIGYFNDVEKNGFLGMAAGGAHELQSIFSNEFTNQSININTGTDPTAQQTCDNQGPFGGIGNFFCNFGKLTSTVNDVINGNLGDLVANLLGLVVSWVVGILAFFIIIIALLIAMFRVWFMLLRAYIFVLLNVILAPFYILAGLLPGSTIGFGSWLRGMAAHLLVFPATVSMFVLIRVLYDNFTCNTVAATGVQTCGTAANGGTLFIPPLIGNPTGALQTDNPLGAFIVLAMVFAMPELLNLINKAFQNTGTGIGAATMGGIAGGGRFLGTGARNIGGGVIDLTQGRTASVPAGFGAVMRGFFGR